MTVGGFADDIQIVSKDEKNIKCSLLVFLSLNLLFLGKISAFQMVKGNWKITFQEHRKTLAFIFKGDTLLRNVIPTAKYHLAGAKEVQLVPDSFSTVKMEREPFRDPFGSGIKVTIRYSKPGLPIMRQLFLQRRKPFGAGGWLH